MNISLSPDLEAFINAEVASGRYPSASEVVGDAVALLQERARQSPGELAEFNEELDRRLSALDRGEVVDPADVRARLQQMSDERRKRTA